ncbi:MAG: hypothetical protein OEY01_04305 [Desulfobulbaceae bacterium]|nr:hypothetical protein [Desulfobulbaceae bacterium]HIJ78406.1 hypothetical protein [Deltaproteobacteria bacterium]
MRLRPGLLMIPLCLFAFSGCSGLLPVAKTTAQSQWDTFGQLKSSYDQIIPFATTSEELNKLGFDPYKTPNIEILNYLSIIEKFMPNSSITKNDLDVGLKGCVEAKNACLAYELKLQKVKSKRHGNVVLDLLRFKRLSQQTGWRFSALIVLVDDLVVYKIWDGKPLIDEEIYKKNPLGPLQEPAEIATDAALVGTF